MALMQFGIIKLGNKAPDGVIELSGGVNLDTTEQGKSVGIDILQASMKMDMDKNILLRNAWLVGWNSLPKAGFHQMKPAL